jgi:hypothetical protein
MATVNKNFRIKNGLVVEGSTGTINGQNILTETGSDQYILDLIGGETLVKSVSSDFSVDGSGNLTINGSSDLARTGDITTAINNLDTDDIEEGASNQYFTSQRAKDAAGELLANASKTNIQISYIPGLTGGLTITAENGVADSNTDDLTEGSTNLYFTNQRALDATASAYDASGAAATAQQNAEDYTDTALESYTPTSSLDSTIDGYGYLKSADLSGYATETYVTNAINGLDTDDIEEGVSNLYFTNQRALDATSSAYDAYGAASTAEGNANTYTDNAINALDTDDIEEGASNQYFTTSRARGAVSAGTGIGYDSGTGVISVDSTIATKTYVDDAIDNLVDGAPGLLDTLNEIAAAINDDANYFTTIANQIAGKQDTLHAGSNINITSNTISVTGLDTDDVAEGTNLYFTDSRARDAVDGTDRSFTSVAINEVSKEVAATTGNIVNAAATTAYAWAKADYRSAKFMVKIKNGSHTEVCELLVTLDTSDNVYLTEYGMSSTSGTSLGTITADVSGADVHIRVTPANNNSEVIVAGTLLI